MEANQDQLNIRVSLDESDGTAECHARVKVGQFSGSGSAWFNTSRLLEFAKELEAYPLRAEALPTLKGGCWNQGPKAELEQVHLSLRFYPVDARGQLGVGVHLASPALHPRDLEARSTVSVELRTSYHALARFAKELAMVVNTGLGEATLHGETLG